MADANLMEIGYKIAIYFIPFLFALCFHELAHGLVAKWFGDNTAELQGRLTMNPASHADVLGTYILPIMAIVFAGPFFGWAKPVPVDSRNLKHPTKDMFWIALAGPLSNLFLAFVGSILLAFFFAYAGPGGSKGLMDMLRIFIMINLFLAVFNLLPIHPLDGGKVMARFLPYQWNRFLEDNQTMISLVFIGVLLMGGFRFLAIPVYAIAQVLISLSANLSQFL